jgi:hypothetical protein
VLGLATVLATSVGVSWRDILTQFHHTRELGRALISLGSRRELLAIRTFSLDQSDDSLMSIRISNGVTPVSSIRHYQGL